MGRAGQMSLIILLAVIAALIAGLGWLAPQIRDAWYFAPARAGAERAVGEIAQAERLLLRRRGHFDTFTTGIADSHLRALGVTDAPDNYLFDAAATPNKGLRLRALPKSDQVLALKVAPQMYVALLAPSGGVLQRGWAP